MLIFYNHMVDDFLEKVGMLSSVAAAGLAASRLTQLQLELA